MNRLRQAIRWGAVLAAVLAWAAPRARAYVEAPYPLGKLVNESTNILVIRVVQVDREKNLVVYEKVRDVKGTHKGDRVQHNIGRGGFHPREWQNVMAWAEIGKTALWFHNGSASETCIDQYWYQSYAGEWWGMSHAEPYLLRTFCGPPEKLAAAVAVMLAGQEVIVPCMVDGDKEALQLRRAKIMRMKAGLAIQDYNPARDFAGWGVEEFRPLAGMPGFTHYAPLSRVDPEAIGVAPTDLDGDAKPDFCLYGLGRAVVLQNGGATLSEIALPLEGGARAAAWADYNADGRPDLLLATPAGPRLFAGDGAAMKDASASLPRLPYYNLMAAAWIDYDGDKRPDVLLADGFQGLRLYRNLLGAPPSNVAPGLGPWHYVGPFDNADGRGFDAVYPPEQGVDLKATYAGKGGEKVAWQEGKFRDGETNNLALFKPEWNENAAVYLYRELGFGGAVRLPVSLGSDDTLTVWLNGARVHAENVARACAPDQAQLVLGLRPGKNALLMKICNGSGEFAFYFSAKGPAETVPPAFADVSDETGLGARGLGARGKVHHLVTADFNGDGLSDILFGAGPPGAPGLALGTTKGFVEVKDCGVAYEASGVRPAVGDFDGDGRLDLFVPQPQGGRLFRNEGGGRFSDVTAKAGALAQPFGDAVCAVWADLPSGHGAPAVPGTGRGRPGLLVGCLRGPNRYFRPVGDGAFADASADLGLFQRVFNTRGMAVLDLSGDGVPDVIFNNEGQESAILLGNPARFAGAPGRAPLVSARPTSGSSKR